jgi:hypothetical protein
LKKKLLANRAFALCAMTTSLCIAASCADANRGTPTSERSTSAVLRLNVFIVPVLQTRETTAAKRQEGSIAFPLASPAQTETYYEVHPLPQVGNADAENKRRAVVRTLTVVPK